MARVGQKLARVPAIVHPAVDSGMAIVGPEAPVPQGSVVQLYVRTASGVAVEWTSSDSQILKLLSTGTFQAVAPGRALVCPRTFGTSRCALVVVQAL